MLRHGSGAALILVGPAFLFALAALFACVLLVALGFDRQQWVLRQAAQAARLLPRRRARCTLWGLSAIILDLAVVALLLHAHGLALLGIFLLLMGLAVLSVGLAAAALHAGLSLAADSALDEDESRSWRVGSLALLLAACVPVVGWLPVAFWLAAGTGAVLEALLAREP